MTDVPSKLGELMLQGWVLTDNPCPASGCRGVPLLRSPKGQEPMVQHCVSCDRSPTGEFSHELHYMSAATTSSTVDVSQTQSQASSIVSSESYASRPSTPPTEIFSNLSSPTFAPPAETEETRRRRQQSDNASTEIGKRLLKGWTMLGEECPNSRCYGIPLVRPPTKNGVKDTRKECVACGTVYMNESDAEALQRLTPTSSSAEHASAHLTGGPGLSIIASAVAPISPEVCVFADCFSPMVLNMPSAFTASYARSHPPNTGTRPLQLALGVLSEKLTLACTAPSLVDLSSVAATSDAINKVAQALGQVNRLRQQDYGRSSSLS
ncbi:hypothetical protein M404DRAFT_124255 [Pisolithus tinctorius Marx 270]|uniref:Uncharacterized protein n=1 Tax=Pisolithus tinctorius Marx 270 TaxID=870435 RepID=A0A0C3PVK9_PISTI|nr:hypothetical protein M404DRAFT_124255 [Pisolithus tinctorius Marx 270]